MNIIFACAFFSVTEEELEQYESIYPGVNVPQELRRMDSWCRANPRRLKRNWNRFILNWLGKTHRDLLAVQTREAVRVYRSRQESRVGTGPTGGTMKPAVLARLRR